MNMSRFVKVTQYLASAANNVQSGIDNRGGSIFATLQSTTAGDYCVAACKPVVQAVGAAIASTKRMVQGQSK